MKRRVLRPALLVIALFPALVSTLSAVEAPEAAPSQLAINYQITAESQEEAVAQATRRALWSAVGRVYFGDYAVRAQDMLGPYFDTSHERFAGSRVNEVQVDGRRFHVNVDIFVDCQELYNDLHEKRFTYRPSPRPVLYVFLEETHAGSPSSGAGRGKLLEKIHEGSYRYLWAENRDDFSVPLDSKTEAPVPAEVANANAMASPEALAAACREAQRRGVEVFVTGVLQSHELRREPVYFEDYTFVEAYCALYVVRSDSGEVIASDKITVNAGHADPEQAVAGAAEAAINRITPGLLEKYSRLWPLTMMREARNRVMVTGADDEVLSQLTQILTGVEPDMRVHTRSRMEDVAILTLEWDGALEDVVEALRRCTRPVLKVVPLDEECLVVQVQ